MQAKYQSLFTEQPFVDEKEKINFTLSPDVEGIYLSCSQQTKRHKIEERQYSKDGCTMTFIDVFGPLVSYEWMLFGWQVNHDTCDWDPG